MMAKMAFSRSFLRNPATSVSRIGSTGSKPAAIADTELRLSSLCEMDGKSTPVGSENNLKPFLRRSDSI